MLFKRFKTSAADALPASVLKSTNGNVSAGLVSIDLNILIMLAKAASALKLQTNTPKAMLNGGYVSRIKGRGMEFDEVRPYQAGDDIRRIDWKVTARTGSAYTKIFREERERPIFIAVDNRPAMHFATRGVFKYVQAAKLAALIAWSAQQHGDRIGGQLFSQYTCQELKPQTGKHGVLRFFSLLVNAKSNTHNVETLLPFSLDQALLRLLQHARPGSRVYIISDFRGFNDKAEQHLAKLARHCDVVLIMVYDPLEVDLPKNGRYRFADDTREVVIDTSNHKSILKYQQLFTARQQHLMRFAQKTGLNFLTCDTMSDPLARLL